MKLDSFGTRIPFTRSSIFAILCFPLIVLVALPASIHPRSVDEPAPAVQNNEVPRFDETDCEDVFPQDWWDNIAQSRFRCGYLVTWENYDSQTNTIRLAVMEAYSIRQPRPHPVIWMAGGPGGSGFGATPAKALEYTQAWERGFIQFSQRGSYLSQSALYCPQVRFAVLRNWEQRIDDRPVGWQRWGTAMSTAMTECYTSIGRDNGFDYLPNINSKFNALDVVYLIRKLGYGNGGANLYGGSYGSLLAQHVMVLSPGDVDSVVLEGVAPLSVDWNAEYPRNLRESLERVFESCNTSTTCNDAYPNLEHTFFVLLNQLQDQPLCISVEDQGRTYSNVCLDDFGFLQALGGMLSASQNIKKIPRIIYASWNRDLDEVAELGANYYSFERNGEWPWGMYYSIYCNEFSRFDPDDIDLSQLEPPFQTLYVANKQLMNKVCLLYDQFGRSYGDTAIFNQDLKILIFNGRFDPLTPMKYGDRVALVMSVKDGFQFTSDISAHNSVDNHATGPCAHGIIREFFEHPEKPPDRTCWEEAPVIEFELTSPSQGSDQNENEGNETSWWTDLQTRISETVQAWSDAIQAGWQRLQESTEEAVNRWWQEQKEKLLNELDRRWAEFQKRLVESFWQRYLDLLNQCLGSVLLPAAALASVWNSRIRKKRDP